jgi:endonuclease YncB( thermonuclease family)
LRGYAERIRFTDIYAPEVFHPDCAKSLRYGLEAAARLTELIRGKIIRIERDGRHDICGCTIDALRIGNFSGVKAGMQLLREDLTRLWKPGAEAREERRQYWCGPGN